MRHLWTVSAFSSTAVSSRRRQRARKDGERVETKDPAVVRENDAKIVLEEGEFVRIYLDEPGLQFSVAELAPGARGPVDPGHKGAAEVAYVITGRLLVSFPNRHLVLEGRAGDSILIPPGEPHQPLNASEHPTVFTWSLAPNPSTDDR